MLATEVLTDGLAFPEGPRWRDGVLWFSDMHAQTVCTVDDTGRSVTVLELDDSPSGLGWLPDGDLLVAAMRGRRLLRFDGEKVREHADLSAHATVRINDMVVDTAGRAYVGHFGFDIFAGESPKPASLLLVHPDGTIEVAADDILFPNGCVLTPDGETLILAETFGHRLTSFAVGPHGSLRERRVMATFTDGARPDGIALDAEHAVWMASPPTKEVIRVRADGTIDVRVSTGERGCYACALGGADGRSLFVCTAETAVPAEAVSRRGGRIEVLRVDVPSVDLA